MYSSRVFAVAYLDRWCLLHCSLSLSEFREPRYLAFLKEHEHTKAHGPSGHAHMHGGPPADAGEDPEHARAVALLKQYLPHFGRVRKIARTAF